MFQLSIISVETSITLRGLFWHQAIEKGISATLGDPEAAQELEYLLAMAGGYRMVARIKLITVAMLGVVFSGILLASLSLHS